MKMKINSILTAVICVFIFTQCSKDFLDLQPKSDVSTSKAYQTASDAENVLVGVYNKLLDGHQNWTRMIMVDILDDNCYAGGDNPNLYKIRAFKPLPTTDDPIFNMWVSCYDQINRANVVLKYVPGISDPKLDVKVDGNISRRDQILGEATYLRAMEYFDLVRIYGDVPVSLAPTESTDPGTINQARKPVAEINAQIIKDLEYCLTVLPDKYGDQAQTRGRATKGAANAMLAQVYATALPVDWNKVKQYADAIISNTSVYHLQGSFAELFDGLHYNNSESIFEIQFQKPNCTAWQYHLILPTSITGDNWRKFMVPTLDLMKTWRNEGDSVRIHASVIFELSAWNDEYWGNNVPFIYKWKHDDGWASGDHWYVQRLAETILLRAEAKAELNDIAGALADLKTVRDRVSLPDKTAALSGKTKDEVHNAILLERRLELAFEGFRWMDLKRTGKAISTLTNVGYTLDEHNLVMPIPQSERDRNPNLTQNAGY